MTKSNYFYVYMYVPVQRTQIEQPETRLRYPTPKSAHVTLYPIKLNWVI